LINEIFLLDFIQKFNALFWSIKNELEVNNFLPKPGIFSLHILWGHGKIVLHSFLEHFELLLGDSLDLLSHSLEIVIDAL